MTGHCYEQVQPNLATSWQQAATVAQQRSYNGMQGYLMTITSASEQQFINNNIVPSKNSWIGGNTIDRVTTQWGSGPENGIVILSNGASGCISYCNFASNQPGNLYYNPCLYLQSGNTQWFGTANCGNNGGVLSFIVEYGPYLGMKLAAAC